MAVNVHQVLLAQAGDREALEALLAHLQGPLFRYLRAVTGNDALAEDALQEALFRVYRKLDWLREPALFEPWAFRIASRIAFRKLAKARRLREEPLEIDVPLAESEERPDVDRIFEHLDSLSPASRAVLTLHYAQSMTLQEVAEVLGLSVGTVKSRLAYGLRCLRAAMGAS